MKGINKLLMLSATVWLLASCSQESATMRTIVNTDGSCEREIWTSPNLSKEGEAETENVLVIDSTWTVGWSYRGDTVIHHEPLTAARYDSIRQDLQRQQINKQVRDTVVSHAHRHFASVEEMAQASAQQSNWRNVSAGFTPIIIIRRLIPARHQCLVSPSPTL